MIHTREDIKFAKRIVIKAGTSVVSTPEGFPSLQRIANIVEHAARLVRMGKEVVIVTSGATGVGKQRLRRQAAMKRSMLETLSQHDQTASASVVKPFGNAACAAAGQLGLMSLYEPMFNLFDITTSQLLVTAFDFTSPERMRNIQQVLTELLELGIVPLLNENDAVSANQGYGTYQTFSDNDSLASYVAQEMSADLLVLLTDVEGVYDRPPNEAGAKVLDVFDTTAGFRVGEKSAQGRGGMGAKVDAAVRAVKGGVQAVVIAKGGDLAVLDAIMDGEQRGTLFMRSRMFPTEIDFGSSRNTSHSSLQDLGSAAALSALRTMTPVPPPPDAREIARATKAGYRLMLAQLSEADRSRILLQIADSMEARKTEILEANAIDVAAAQDSPPAILSRLSLTEEKLQVLCEGIRGIAAQEGTIGREISHTELASGLELQNITCPIGVLLVIFESRPDCLPQIAALALKSGNGLIAKGGKEAEQCIAVMLSIIQDAIRAALEPVISDAAIREQMCKAVSIVSTRDDVSALLELDDCIDLVVPRGSSTMVTHIKNNTKIPVMGHAEGICHIYIDSEADILKATRIVLDAKMDYPSACNAVETLLIHRSLLEGGKIDMLLRELRSNGISAFGGPAANAAGLVDRPAESLSHEYGNLGLTVEVVEDVNAAIRHIGEYGSGHTECIVTENTATAEAFLRAVDSACVFHNASTRFADGYRFGLGAEVGVSTGRIHARGPVGVTGLMTHKWVLRSRAADSDVATAATGTPLASVLQGGGHTVGMFSQKRPAEDRLEYTFKNLQI